MKTAAKGMAMMVQPMINQRLDDKCGKGMRAVMDKRPASAQQTVKTTSRNWRLGLTGLLAALFLCLSSTAWAAAMVTNGAFNNSTSWTLGGTGMSYSTAQNHVGTAGTGSLLETVTGKNRTVTGTAVQAVTVTAGSVINAKTDIVAWAMESFTGTSGATRTVTIDLRYSDATTVNIFSGTVAANSAWTNLTNNTVTAFPLTLAKNVNQITVTVVTSTGNNATAASSLYTDDIAITYTPAVIDSLTVTSSTPVATTAIPGVNNIQMEYLQLNSDAAGNGSCVLTSATVDDVNIAATGTIANLKVHIDSDSNFSNGVLGTATVATWDGQSVVVDLTGIAAANRTVTNGVPRYLWITYDIDALASNGTTVISRVTAIGVAAPDIAPLGGPWDSNSVLITAGLGCGGCHPLPVLDGVARTGATGAVQGNHATHGTTFAYACNTCHIEGSQTPGGTYTSRHRRGTIEMNVSGIGAKATARYDKNTDHVADTAWAQSSTPTLGKCENTDCHGGTNAATLYGGPTGAGPTWGSSHTSTCTFCHNKAKTDSGVAADAYPTAASPFRSTNAAGAHLTHLTLTSNLMNGGTVACADCHTVPGTVNAAGHILTNIAAPADLTFGARAQQNTTTTAYDSGTLSCSVYCHGFKTPGGDAGATDSTPAWTANWTTYVPGTPGTCSNYCHGLPPSSTAHNTYTFPGSCKGCHGSTVTTTTDPPTIVASFHINGVVEATGCSGCHGGGSSGSTSGTKNIWPDDSTANAANVSGRHVRHMTVLAARAYGFATLDALLNDATADTKQKALCDYCHQGSTNDADHPAGTLPAEVFPAGYAKMLNNTAAGVADGGTVASYSSNQHGAGGNDTCSNVDCHNNKLTTAGTYGWYNAGTSTCMMCHTISGTNNPTSGLHAVVPAVTEIQHDDSFGSGGTCASCHTMTGKIEATAGTHVNAAFTGDGSVAGNFTAMGLNAAVYTASANDTGTCSGTGTSCHGNATASLNYRDDWKHQWNSTANYYTTNGTACGGCHGDFIRGWNTGVIHRTAANVKTNHGDGGTNYECKECHTLEDSANVYTFTFGTADWDEDAAEVSKHGNGTIEINNATGTSYNETTGLCASGTCHPAAADGTHDFLNTSWTIAYLTGASAPAGSGGCITCHGANVTANLGAVNTDSAFPNGGSHAGNFGMAMKHITGGPTDDTQCKVCHNDATQPMNTGSAKRDIIQLKNADTGAVIEITQSQTETTATRNSATVTFCTSCHDANGATSTFRTGYAANNPFGTGVAPKNIAQYYNDTITGKTHNYAYNNTPQLVKARSPHGKPTTNVMKNETARVNFAADTAPVGCESCHPSHGGTNTNPVPVISGGAEINSTTVTASMMLTGYSEPGSCWTCHNAAGVKDYYGDKTGGNGANLNWTGVQNSSITYKQRNYWSRHQVHQTAFSVARASARATADTTANVTCSECHNPHGATTWVGANGTVAYQSFSLRGNWMTSPYLEDRAPTAVGATATNYAGRTDLGPRTDTTSAYNRPAILGHGYSAAGGTGFGGYYLDENTFGPPAAGYPTGAWTTMGEGAASFAGLCANCHAAAVSATSGGTVVTMQGYLNNASSTGVADWSATAKVHNTVKGWYVATNSVDQVNFTNNPRMRLLNSTFGSAIRVIQSSGSYSPRPQYAWGVNLTNGTKQAYHAFSCSKCHTPHASSVPRLMVSNCLDVGTGTASRAAKTHSVNAGATQRPAYTYPTYGTSWSGAATGSDVAQHCHNFKKTNTSGGGGWNQLTGW
jgi:hypothetical protein